MTSISAQRRGLACVKCSAFQPTDGKLLHCMHVICAGCGNDAIAEENSIKCCSCGDISKPVVSGVSILEQLKSCEAFLYTSSASDKSGLPVIPADPRDTRPKRLCELCPEDDDAAATHACEGCGGALLCQSHADQHPKTKMFTGHVVTVRSSERRDIPVRRGLENYSSRCFVHKQHNVVTFCKTCSHAVCTECLAAGHRGHSIDTLSSVAAEQLSAVRAAMESSKNWSSDSTELSSIQTLLTAVSDEMEEIRQEAETASHVITDTFDRVDSMILQKRKQLLHQVETNFREQLAGRESRQQRLFSLEENYTTAMKVVEGLTSCKTTNEDVIHLAGVVIANLAKLSLDLEAEKTPLNRGKIAATPITDELQVFEKQVQSLALVKTPQLIDIAKAVVSIPDNVHANEPCPVSLTFPRNPGNTSPVLTAKISAPSGQLNTFRVSRSSDSSSDHLSMRTVITPTQIGEHFLEIHDEVGNTKSVSFDCSRFVPILDADKRSQRITLSGDNKVATQAGLNAWSTVAARHGYTAGRHTWNVSFLDQKSKIGLMSVGVTALPGDANCNRSGFFFDNVCNYSWDGKGRSSVCGVLSGVDCSQFSDGEVASLTLDCEQATLEIYHHRTGEQRVMTEVKCEQPLYPAFCMYCEGQRVGFW